MISGPPLGAGDSVARLVLDVPSGVLWVVVEGVAPGRLLEYDTVRLRLIRELSGPGAVNGAAALDGHLYLTSGARLFEVGPGRPPHSIADVQTLLAGVVADPARHRLLMFGNGANTQVWPIELTARGAAVRARPVVVALGKSSVGVAEGSVWIAGFGGGRWVLHPARSPHPAAHDGEPAREHRGHQRCGDRRQRGGRDLGARPGRRAAALHRRGHR